jgi:hypothetical protein
MMGYQVQLPVRMMPLLLSCTGMMKSGVKPGSIVDDEGQNA